jgi:hypothetical protein
MVPTEIDEQGRGAEFTLADGTTFGVWKPDEHAAGGCVMLAVDDLAAAVAALRASAASTSATPTRRPCASWPSPRIPTATR